MKLSKTKMPLLLIVFLILEGCASAPKTTKFDGAWVLVDINAFKPGPVQPEDIRACLTEPDTEKLRQLLIECQSK